MNNQTNTPGKIRQAALDIHQKTEERFINAFLEKDDTQEHGYTLKTGKVGEKIVNGYKTVENCVITKYQKVEDAFVNAFLEKKESTPSDETT